jgi:hypothetical protein
MSSTNGSSSNGLPAFGRSGASGAQPQIDRPTGITLLTLYDGIMLGVRPGLWATVTFMSQPAAERPSVLAAFGVLLFSATLIIAAAAAWRGENWARYALTGLVVLHHGALALDAGLLLGVLVDVGSESWWRWGYLLRAVLWIGLHVWYLFYSRAAAFFRPAP